MKKIFSPYLIFVLLTLFVRTSFGQIHPVASESSVHFSIKNFGLKTGGVLDPPKGDIQFSPEDLGKSFFHVSIPSASINTDNESRDEHLRNEDYFDVKNYPSIVFTADAISATSKKGLYTAHGTLKIKKTSKPTDLIFTAEKNGEGWLFAGSLKLNRRDFEVGGGSTVSNELTVDIKVVAR